jgi:hypothetical protein
MEWHLCISFARPRPVSDQAGFFMELMNAWNEGNLVAAGSRMLNVEAWF